MPKRRTRSAGGVSSSGFATHPAQPAFVSQPSTVAPSAFGTIGPKRAAHSFQKGARLHVGCGKRRLHGWINADAVPGVGDVVLDLHGELPNEAFCEIYGSHVLEHCWPQDTPGILRRLFHALLPGGTLRLSVPDLRLVVKNCVDSQAYGGERSAMTVLFGGEFSRSTPAPDLHRQAFWKERLERLLAEAGFTNIREWGRGQYPAIDALGDFATQPCDSSGKSLISLNMEADRPGTLHIPTPVSVVPARTADGGVDISVLLGTVERPQMLKDCVEAIRKSLEGSGLKHEIVVAYGRDNESALPWMRSQPDIVPVLGGMDGAIEAFNRAYKASCGRLVCQLNDDVLVDGDSIARAARHLDTNVSSAGVVFKFDRGDGKGYRHERVADALHPNQMVVRRETCEAVIERIGAFWGDSEHRTDKTYGGDSAFGVLCRYLGLRLDSVEGVTCRDLLAPDELRARNAASIASDHGRRWTAMYQPYMQSFAQVATDEWPNVYVPRRGMAPRRSPIAAGRPLRTLALPIVMKDWTQTALRSALRRIGPYAEVLHDGRPRRDMLDVVRSHKPELIWAQVQGAGWQDFARELKIAAGPSCTVVQWTGDVRTDGSQPVERWLVDIGQHFDILLADNCTYPKKLKQQGARAACGYLSHGSEDEIVWEPNAIEDRRAAVFFGTNYKTLDGGARERLFGCVARQTGNLIVYGQGWDRTDVPSRPFVHIEEVGKIMRRTSLTICASLFHNLERYTSNRLKYALNAGAVAAVCAFDDMEGLGLRDGINCLVWRTPEDLVALVQKWTRPDHDLDRQRIREAAASLAAERHTWNHSVEELLAIVRDHRARKGLA